MKSFFIYNLGLILVFISCKKEKQDDSIEIQKSIKQKELVFNSLDKAWVFSERKLTPESEIIALNWNEWRLFINELYQKPKSSLNAFKLKTKNLVQKVDVLPNTIPIKLQKPQINVRLSAIITKIKALNMFLNVDRIPEQRVVMLVSDLNLEVNAFNDQIEEIVRRSHIQMEEGEEDMIKRINGKQSEYYINPDLQNPTKQEVPSFEEIK
ncbi:MULTISPECIES: hypothetical protein [Flavobacterium]|uniref:Lipoprotein n=2 Tax=Flavobacterium TaxID=237 RepID=A0AA94F420_9FLAO|nr:MULTISPECIES: hypothetical protein [Flavobacterium]OXA77216.1 hypothetical protein B0A56_09745 [Flavobacterium columnare NBRC 100251 = ATCC 23463]AMA48001.1 hypothetical protein AWN65_00260 [Flavobacterium covae]AND63857.1 hypothetical protein AX766_05205 [Flavobacterium covae]MCH4829900.1 hypothetical protein [Flavobacterium columnare]MCH4832719.1 hypothetical protein [Flavobacterium columnare]